VTVASGLLKAFRVDSDLPCEAMKNVELDITVSSFEVTSR